MSRRIRDRLANSLLRRNAGYSRHLPIYPFQVKEKCYRVEQPSCESAGAGAPSLVLEGLDDGVAFEIGCAINKRASVEALGIVVSTRTSDRQLFFASTAARRSSIRCGCAEKNAVRHFLQSSYRLPLEHQSGDRSFAKQWALTVFDYLLAGGGLPVSAENAVVVGSSTVSGLEEDLDRAITVDALCGSATHPSR